ncbi:S26 family signal peptidase [Sphingomonas donggukensis]|uniref:S26 family signal peptidase n=1 Tax=Sphingomonas donggukensis TaxID=2949093 RepID=A0ABY4TTZ7_9SPHN|nr:S26 family signal peptidase [Sphingomonas donggukensis]URW75878.1 S26 family signal peptidase [Sphingomonas donggukensis]
MLSRTVVALAGIALLAGPALAPPLPRLVWNATPSAPVGLYRVEPTTLPRRGALVLVLPPPRLARLFAARGYLPEHVPLLKRIAAQPGQRLCRFGNRVTVDGRVVALALAHDRRGRPLPCWHGCRSLGSDELFVLSPGVRDALDGRYFGPLPRAAMIGVATPLWTRNDR